MPNKVFFTDGKTQTKAMRALAQNDGYKFEDVIDIIERLQEAGIQLVESAPKGAVASAE